MKKFVKIAAIVIAVLVVLVIATLKFAPGIVRSYVVGHSEELIGRKVAIQNISLNPFTFKLEIDSLAVFEKDGETRFVAFDKFRVNVDPKTASTSPTSSSSSPRATRRHSIRPWSQIASPPRPILPAW